MSEKILILMQYSNIPQPFACTDHNLDTDLHLLLFGHLVDDIHDQRGVQHHCVVLQIEVPALNSPIPASTGCVPN